jgi:hypothetical protein
MQGRNYGVKEDKEDKLATEWLQPAANHRYIAR